MEFDEVWTLSFAAGNADNEFRSFAQEAVVALEEVKRRSSAEAVVALEEVKRRSSAETQ